MTSLLNSPSIYPWSRPTEKWVKERKKQSRTRRVLMLNVSILSQRTFRLIFSQHDLRHVVQTRFRRSPSWKTAMRWNSAEMSAGTLTLTRYFYLFRLFSIRRIFLDFFGLTDFFGLAGRFFWIAKSKKIRFFPLVLDGQKWDHRTGASPVVIFPRLKGGSYEIKVCLFVCLFVCLSVCLSVTGSKEHCREGHELRDESMVSGVIRYGESESGISY